MNTRARLLEMGISENTVDEILREHATTRRVPVEVYSRVVGYFRPVNQWNPGKREEFRERKEFSIEKAKEGI